MVLLPGFIDSHAHAGHGLMKNIGEGIIQSDILDLLLYRLFPVFHTRVLVRRSAAVRIGEIKVRGYHRFQLSRFKSPL